eukprot:UN05119
MSDEETSILAIVLCVLFCFFYGIFLAVRKSFRIQAREERINGRRADIRTQRLYPNRTTINKNPALQPTYANSTTNPTLPPVTAPVYANPTSQYPPAPQPF